MSTTVTEHTVDSLPPKQRETYDVVKAFYDKYGFPPSLTEIAERMKVAKPTAQSHVGKLINKGILDRVIGRIVIKK